MAALDNEKHERFCHEYVVDLNGTKAAKTAGYSAKTAASQANRLLKNANIRARIAELTQEAKTEKIADATEVMEFLTAVIRGEKKEQVVMMGVDGSLIAGSKIIGGREQVKAAELLAKRYGLLTENVKLNGSAVVQIVDDLGGGADGG